MVGQWLLPFALLCTPLLAMQIVQAATGEMEPVRRWAFPLRVVTYASVMALIVLLGEDFGEPFIYFQF